jgi:hypothetical protein
MLHPAWAFANMSHASTSYTNTATQSFMAMSLPSAWFPPGKVFVDQVLITAKPTSFPGKGSLIRSSPVVQQVWQSGQQSCRKALIFCSVQYR